MQHVPQAVHSPFPHGSHSLNVEYLHDPSEQRIRNFLQFPPPQFHFSVPFLPSEAKYAEPPVWDNALHFLQQWGFFGLIEAACRICNLSYNREEFIDGAFVTSRPLEKLSMRWEERRRGLTREVVDSILMKLDECVHAVARHVVQAFPESKRSSAYRHVDRPSLIPLSVQILTEVLGGWVIRPFDTHDSGRVDSRLDVSRSEFVHKRLLDAGWCPKEIEAMERVTKMSFSHMLMVSSIDRRFQNRVHDTISSRPTACACEDPVRRVVHASTCTRICTTFTDEEWVGHIIAARTIVSNESELVLKQVPVLRVTGNAEQGTTQIEIRPVNDGVSKVPYVAISHVWVDGLGPAAGKYLPNCQLQHIQKLVDRLVDQYPVTFTDTTRPIYFWLDPICVPKVNGVYDTMSDRALQSMGDIYRKAKAVIVLDSAAQIDDFDGEFGEKPEIHAARIAFSRWMSRGWTFQEAGLAANLFFCFNDMFTNLLELRTKYARAKNTRTESTVLTVTAVDGRLPEEDTYFGLSDPCYCHSTNQLYGVWRWWAEAGDPVLDGLRRLYWRLSERTVSDRRDEASIIRILLSSQHRPETRSDAVLQMQHLFESFSKVPLEFLFWDGPRVLEPRKRWIPASILRPDTRTGCHGERKITRRTLNVTPGGACVQLKGLYFQIEEGELAPQQRECLLIFPEPRPAHLLYFETLAIKPSWNELQTKRLVILLQPETVGGHRFDPGPQPRQVVLASEVDPGNASRRPKHLEFEAVVMAYPVNVGQNDGRPLCRGTVQQETPEDFEWCIG